jgi:hypothetical protein
VATPVLEATRVHVAMPVLAGMQVRVAMPVLAGMRVLVATQVPAGMPVLAATQGRAATRDPARARIAIRAIVIRAISRAIPRRTRSRASARPCCAAGSPNRPEPAQASAATSPVAAAADSVRTAIARSRVRAPITSAIPFGRKGRRPTRAHPAIRCTTVRRADRETIIRMTAFASVGPADRADRSGR